MCVVCAHGQASPSLRIQRTLQGCLGVSAFMLATVLFLDMNSMHSPYLYFAFLMLACGVTAMIQMFLQSATMNFCTRLDIGGGLLSYMLVGQALNGLFGSIVNLGSLWLSTQLTTHEAASAHILQNKRAATAVFSWTWLLQALTLILFRAMLCDPTIKSSIEAWTSEPLMPTEGGHAASWSRIVSVQKRIVPWSASIFGLFLVTLTVYPGLTSRVRTLTYEPWKQNPNVFVAWHLVAMNTGDLVGRRLPLMLPWVHVRDSRIAMGAMLLRTLFFPAIFACHIWPDQTQSFSDATFFALVFSLGLTSGWLSTSFLVSGPQSVHLTSGVYMEDMTLLSEQTESQAPNVGKGEEAAIASMLLSFWLVSGLASGAGMSLIINMLMG